MTTEASTSINLTDQVAEAPTEQEIKFCEEAVSIMSRFYGVTKLDFEQMLQKGYTEIRFGRGPLGYSDKGTGEYIVSFAAFIRKDSSKTETFEVRKNNETFGSITQGLSKRRYSSKKYQETTNRFKLFLVTDNLAGFIQRFNWSKQ